MAFSLGPVTIRRFGVTASNPAILQLKTGAGLSLFTQPAPKAYTPNDVVQEFFPSAFSATADSWGNAGQKALPRQLLVAPRNGYTNGTLVILAAGDITIPTSAIGASIALLLNQNYFTQQPSSILITTDNIAIASATLGSGTYQWSMSCAVTQTFGNAIQSTGSLTINGVVTEIDGLSLQNSFDPHIQLSMGAIFGGTVSGSDVFQARMSQFEMQQ